MRVVLALAGMAAATAAPALSQEATIYRDRNFSGPAVAVSEAKADLGLRFDIQSIRVNSGRWELCPERNFRGRCLTVDRTQADLYRAFGWPGRLQSIRPVAGGDGGSGGPSTGESLRGMAAEFYPRPTTRRGRVPACPGSSATAACAAENANRFCREQGWIRSANQRMETIRGTNYLVDVLCVRG